MIRVYMHDLKAQELNQLFLSGEIKAKEVARYFLQRAHAANSFLGCFLEIFDQQVLEKAELLDKKKELGLPLSPLACVPFSVKDNIHIKDKKTTCASRSLAHFIAPFTASCVKFLEEADALCIGKTNLDECAMGSSTETSAFQKTHNPWNLAYSPGGSSGGAAASLASRSVLFALGSDTGGSTRQPAAYNNVLGFKPSRGFFSRFGLAPMACSLDEIAPMALCSSDMAIICNHLSRPCYLDPFYTQREKPLKPQIEGSLKAKTLGVPWDFLKNLHPYVLKAFQESLSIFTSLGAQIVAIDLKNLEYSLPIYQILSCIEAYSHLAKIDGITFSSSVSSSTPTLDSTIQSRSEGFGQEVKQRLLLGAHLLNIESEKKYHEKALRGQKIIRKIFHEAFQDCSLIALPTTSSKAFKLGALQDPLHMYLQDLFTISANLTGLPALSIPMGFCHEHLPLGLQLIGQEQKEQELFLFSHLFETKTKFIHQIPPLFNKKVL